MPSAQNDSYERITTYDPQIALEFFKAAGTPETVAQGATIFTEHQKANRLLLQRDKMYLLAEGEVEIRAADQCIGTIRPGDIFGELASLALAPRTASAIAKTPCNLIGLDEKQLLAGLQQQPEFALMLMGLIIARLRETLVSAQTNQTLAESDSGKESSVFDRKLLRDLARELGNRSPVYVLRGQTIFQRGGAGIFMHIILEGHATASIDGKIVERIGPGGVIGEIALVDQAPRMADVVAEKDCQLLAITRPMLLALVRAKPAFSLSLLRALAARLRFLIAGDR